MLRIDATKMISTIINEYQAKNNEKISDYAGDADKYDEGDDADDTVEGDEGDDADEDNHEGWSWMSGL